MDIFFDNNGVFQWSSIAAGVAFIAALIQIFNNQKSIDANLKAKSRVEWIQSVRKLSADYIKISYEYRILIGDYLVINGNGNFFIDESKISKDNKNKIDIKYSELLYTYNLLLLYFQNGDNTDKLNIISNDEIITSIETLKIEMENFHKTNISDIFSFEKNGIIPFRDNMRAYLKGEWDRAKSGK